MENDEEWLWNEPNLSSNEQDMRKLRLVKVTPKLITTLTEVRMT
jgi:hypothetical protein